MSHRLRLALWADLGADAAPEWVDLLSGTIKALSIEAELLLWINGSARSYFPDLEVNIQDDDSVMRQAFHRADMVFYFACDSAGLISPLTDEIPGVIILSREDDRQIASQSLAILKFDDEAELQTEGIRISCRNDPDELSKTLMELAKSRSVLHSHLAVRRLALTVSEQLQRLFGDEAALLSPSIAMAIHEILVPAPTSKR